MAVAVSGAMLQAMEPSAQTQPSPTSSNFAGLLAALASPIRDAADVDPPWGGSDLGEDVETLSYETRLARARPIQTSRSRRLAVGAGDEPVPGR